MTHIRCTYVRVCLCARVRLSFHEGAHCDDDWFYFTQCLVLRPRSRVAFAMFYYVPDPVWSPWARVVLAYTRLLRRVSNAGRFLNWWKQRRLEAAAVAEV